MFRFRKSIGIGPFRINISKSGVWASVWVKWARVGVSSGWKKYGSVWIPGTGISWFKYFWSKSDRKEPQNYNEDDYLPENFCQWELNEITAAPAMSSRLATFVSNHPDWINQTLVLAVGYGEIKTAEVLAISRRLGIEFHQCRMVFGALEAFGFVSKQNEELHRDVVSQEFMESYLAENGGSFAFPKVLCSACQSEVDEDTLTCHNCWYNPNEDGEENFENYDMMCAKCLLRFKDDDEGVYFPCQGCRYDPNSDNGINTILICWCSLPG